MAKTLTIFVIYNKNGLLIKSTEYLLSKLMEISSRVIVVVNGVLKENSKKGLLKYPVELFQRENFGFDGGAYKDVFLSYLTYSDLKHFDEIVLCNDTFYGPLYSFESMFSKMRKEVCDYWGMSKRLKGGYFDGIEILPHIQGYFIVCNSSLFLSSAFLQFWENLEYPLTYIDAVLNYEIGFSRWFEANKFISKSYLEVNGWQFKSDVNDYSVYCGTLISEYNFQILKKKAIVLYNFNQVSLAFDFIKKNNKVLFNYIQDDFITKECEWSFLSPEDVNLFIKKYKNVWIYGAGKIGNGIINYFNYKGYSYSGVVVTKINDFSKANVVEFKQLTVSKDDGFILALGKAALSEVLPYIRKYVSNEQLLIPEIS